VACASRHGPPFHRARALLAQRASQPTSALALGVDELSRTAKPCVCRPFTKGERGDSNPRPPGPQPLEPGMCGARRPGFIGFCAAGSPSVFLSLFPNLFPKRMFPCSASRATHGLRGAGRTGLSPPSSVTLLWRPKRECELVVPQTPGSPLSGPDRGRPGGRPLTLPAVAM